jgi:peptidoglycan/xylan/chitin deacetylase (PgdA/CDA1 family)
VVDQLAQPCVRARVDSTPKLAFVSQSSALKIPILMYHRVSASSETDRYTVSAGEFQKQMRALKESGYRVLTLGETVRELDNQTTEAAAPVCVTFDDGFLETFECAASVLSELRFSATFFLVSGLMGLTNRWDAATSSGPECALMDWKEAKFLLSAGFDIGSHSVSHRVLTELSDAEALHEVRVSKQEIEDHLGTVTKFFAYPHGRFDQRIRDLVADAGYEAACSTLSGFATAANDSFALRRIEIFGGDSVRIFLRKVRFGANEMSAAQVLQYYVKQGLSRIATAAR